MRGLILFLSILVLAVVLAQGYQEEFDLANRKLMDTGESKYFVLKPGFQLVLSSKDTTLTITVLNETRKIGAFITRAVEEREEQDGELSEVARDFYAIDPATGDVFIFGEEVDTYEKGKVVDHNGTWMAYKNGGKPGLAMPGNPKVGMKYYQEMSPGIVMDRAEVISLSKTVKTQAGEFKNCLQTEGSSKLDPSAVEFRIFAPGVGLVQFESLKLVRQGYVK